MISKLSIRKSFVVSLILVTFLLPSSSVYGRVPPDTPSPSPIPIEDSGTGGSTRYPPPPPPGDPGGHHSHGSHGGSLGIGLVIGITGAIAIPLIEKLLANNPPPSIPPPHVPKNSNLNISDEKNLVDNLLNDGPQFALQYNTSAFIIRGLVKGGWPVIVDFEQNEIGPINLKIKAAGVDTFIYRLDVNKIGHHQIILRLPDELGNQVRPALIAITAVRGSQSKQTQQLFRITQIGVGPEAVESKAIDSESFQPSNIYADKRETAAYRFYSHTVFDKVAIEFMKAKNKLPDKLSDQVKPALIPVTFIKNDQSKKTLLSFDIAGVDVSPRAVGSLAIDQVLFQPSNIHAGKGEIAAYRFYSHSNFDRVSVEFMKAENRIDGRIFSWVANHLFYQGLPKDHWIGYPQKQIWDGKSESKQVSYGDHKLQVRVWDYRGDWVAAWSDSSVTVLD